MKIGIIVAMGKELRLLLNLIENKKEEENNGYKIYSGKIGTHDIFAMQCGIGKVNAAIGTLTLINEYAPELVINTGVAGGADLSVGQMDIVVGKNIAHHDVWCGPGTEYGEASGFPLYFNSDEKITEILKSLSTEDNVRYGLICSGDKFIATEEEVKEIKSHFREALAVDMESASIAQVCHLKNVPVFVMRVISDTPGAEKDNVKQYENFWESAPEHTFQMLSNILSNIK